MKARVLKRSMGVVLALAAVLIALMLCGCSSAEEQEAETIEGLDELGAVSVVAREEGSGTRSVFSEQVGLIEEDESGVEVDITTSDAFICNDAEAVIEAVAGNESAIGYVSLGSLSEAEGVKAIAIAGAEATEETVNDGSYPLSRGFYIAYSGSATAVETDFLKYIKTAGQKVVEDGYISVASATRFLSDESSGSILITGSTSVAPLMESLASAYAEENPNATITVEASDSTSGLNDAMQQDSDWGMSSRELEEYEQELLETELIAKDAVVVIVNENSPVESLTQAQLYSLFSGEAVYWQDINS